MLSLSGLTWRRRRRNGIEGERVPKSVMTGFLEVSSLPSGEDSKIQSCQFLQAKPIRTTGGGEAGERAGKGKGEGGEGEKTLLNARYVRIGAFWQEDGQRDSYTQVSLEWTNFIQHIVLCLLCRNPWLFNIGFPVFRHPKAFFAVSLLNEGECLGNQNRTAAVPPPYPSEEATAERQ